MRMSFPGGGGSRGQKVDDIGGRGENGWSAFILVCLSENECEGNTKPSSSIIFIVGTSDRREVKGSLRKVRQTDVNRVL